MKGYGLPRNHSVGSPDCADLSFYGLAARKGNLTGKGGVTHSCQRSSVSKSQSRRGFKRIARKEGKAQCYSFDD